MGDVSRLAGHNGDRRRARRRLWLALGTASLLGEPGLGHAQTAAPVVDPAVVETGDIVVTARRRSERLQDVPVSITAVSGDLLREQSVVRTEDLQRIAPGFSSAASARGGSNPGYAIRGMKGVPGQTLLLDPAVGIYFADFNLSRGSGTNQTFYDLQSVQVLRGPQGTLFGRNSTGGALLIEPNRPTDRFEGYVEGSLGDYALRDVEGMINVPLGDTLSLRVAGKLTRRDGYMHDVVNDRYGNEINATSGRLSLRWQPTLDIVSDTIATGYRGRGADNALKLAVFNPLGVPATLGVARPQVVAALQSELAATQALGPYEYRAPPSAAGEVKDDVWSIQNNSTINLHRAGFLGDLTLKNIIGFRRVVNRYPTPYFAGNAVDIFHHDNGHMLSDQWSEELQLQGKAGRLNYLIGAYYFNEQGNDGVTSVQFNYLASPAFLAASTPAVRTFVSTRYPSLSITDNDVRNQSLAGFLHADYDLSGLVSGLTLAGGVRITKDTRDVVYHGERAVGVPPAISCLSRTDPATGKAVVQTTFDREACAVAASLSYSKPTYDVSLSYKIAPDVLAYGSYNRGYRSGGFNNSPPQIGSLVGASFRPEFVDAFELGFKSSWKLADMPVRFNAAVFHEKFTDLQRQVLSTLGTGASTFVATAVTNASGLRMNGGEVELSLRPTHRLTLSANYAGIDPKYTSFTDSQVLSGVNTVIDVSDSRLGFVPYWQATATATWLLPLPDRWGEATLLGTVSSQGAVAQADITTANCGPTGTYLNCLNSGGTLRGYTLANARLDWQHFAGTRVDVALFVNNLTNRYYQTFAVAQLATLGTSAVVVGAPRMWGMTVRIPFGDAR